VLAELVDILPNAEESPVKPFLSLVVNINVCTVAHRDAKDFRLCLVLPIGNFMGGGLVMREQGVVVEMRNGDFACFRSAETTHFNLDYLGERASLVLHSDGEFQKWKDNRNGWSNHGYFNST
jgi:predicted membrane-bound spermidine synthase